MSEPSEKKPKAPRRPKHEVAADYERRAARIKWAGVRDAVDSLREAAELVSAAKVLAGDKASGADFDGAVESLMRMAVALRTLIPEEAR